MVAPGAYIMDGLGQIAKARVNRLRGTRDYAYRRHPIHYPSPSPRTKMPQSFILEAVSRGFLDKASLNHKAFTIQMNRDVIWHQGYT